nr:unnamed protein product [Callosobruchus chinensis]
MYSRANRSRMAKYRGRI